LDIRSRLSPLVAYFSRIALGATTLLEQQVGAGVRPALDALSKITEELGRSKQAIAAYDWGLASSIELQLQIFSENLWDFEFY